jgi:hypothetical protein
MLIVGVLLCYLSGCSVVMAVSRRFSLAEITGYSFLVGMGLQTVFLFLLDIVQLHYTQFLLIALNLVVIIALNRKLPETIDAFKAKFAEARSGLKSVNYVAVFLFLIIAYLFYAITIKNLFWPPSEGDSITSFDKLARVIALEGKLKISLFQYNLQGAAGTYPPLFHGSFAYVYIFGAETPKVVITFFFLSLLLAFYGFVRSYTNALSAMLFTLILMSTPELYAHAALALGNMPTAAYISAAVLATWIWLDRGDEKYFWIGAIMMGFSVWIRSDAIAFVLATLFMIALKIWQNKNYKHLFIYAAMGIIPFAAWLLYVKLKIELPQASRFDLSIGYNATRLNTMLNYVKAYLFAVPYREVHGGQLYGIVFISFFLALLVNTGLAFKRGFKAVFGVHTLLLIFLLVAFSIYFTEFYLINEDVQASSIASLMASSFKRGMFYFIPIVLFYTATSYGVKIFFDKLERFRAGN